MLATFTILIVITLLIVLIVAGVMLFKLFYVEVPQSCALILNGSKVIFAGTVVLPGVKRQTMQMTPVHIKTLYQGNEGLFSQEELLLDVAVTYSLCVEATEPSVLTVMNSVGIEEASDAKAVERQFGATFRDILAKLIKQYSFESLDKEHGKLRKIISQQVEHALKGYSLEYISIDKIVLTPLQNLTAKLVEQQQEPREAWNEYKRTMLERRLEKAVEQQLRFSIEVKKLIENYNKVIKERIKFLNERTHGI